MNVIDIKKRILDINSDGLDKSWCEGYLSALVDTRIINEDEFDELMSWLNSMHD